MDLLMAQFNQVALTMDDIKQILGNDFGMWELKLKSKFEVEGSGLYFNRKLREETIKRKMFTESRRKNLKKEAYHKPNHMREHMENENISENENKIGTKKRVVFTPPTVEEVRQYCLERRNNIKPQEFVDHYQANKWFRGKTKIADWKACIRTWEYRDNIPKPGTEAAAVIQHDSWETKADKGCDKCRGRGGIYSAEKGHNVKCSCVKN